MKKELLIEPLEHSKDKRIIIEPLPRNNEKMLIEPVEHKDQEILPEPNKNTDKFLNEEIKEK